MSIEAVLISLKLKDNQISQEASGTLFNDHFVLVTGAILIPLLNDPEQRKWIISFVKSCSSKLEKNNHLNKLLFCVFRERTNHSEAIKVSEGKLMPQESTVVGVWKCSLVTHSLENLFYDWTLGYVNTNNSKDQSGSDIDVSKELMSIFIILNCKKEPEETKIKYKLEVTLQALCNLGLSLVEPNRGQEVEVVSTPFGNTLFFNSLSRGVISNVIGQEKCLVLTDARTVSGCEGGPTYMARRNSEKGINNLLGIVTCPLIWWRGEWVGLTIGINLKPVIKKLLQTYINPDQVNKIFNNPLDNVKEDSLALQFIDETVVLIRNESSWGSGVILDARKGVVITCSHVVKNGQNIGIFYKEQYYPVSVVYKTQDELAYDLAIVKVLGKSTFTKAVEFCEKAAQIGDGVIAVGYPFFSERDDYKLRPSLAQGCIAKAGSHMIQTTCCIQSGFSGGALLKDGKLLGIIISNARDSTNGVLFPHINFAVPSPVFRKPVVNYLQTNDENCLKVLECKDSKIQSLWALQTSKL